jgi:hypothetical protein
MCLFKIFHLGVFVILFNDYLKRTFPEKYNNILIDISIKSVYVFTRFQIICFNIYNQVKIINKKETRNEICQVTNNGIYLKYFNTDISDIKFEENPNCFYIFSDYNSASDNCVNKVLLYSQPFTTSKYEVSNIKFISLELKLNDNTYKINLKNSELNYYIVNNIFDKNFFIYFLKNYQICSLTVEDIEKIDKFDIKLIDQDVNIKELEITDKKFILIKKDEYIY